MILYLNACVRARSRTDRLARHLLSRLKSVGEETVREIRLEDLVFPKVDEDFINTREELISKGDFDHPMFESAKIFAAADTIVIGAPFWDLSFPAALKQYFEQINAIGITFRYTETGAPQGLCKAKKLYYVTTAGGRIGSDAFGYGYVKALAQTFYGISNTEMISAEGLDMVGADTERILQDAFLRIRNCTGANE